MSSTTLCPKTVLSLDVFQEWESSKGISSFLRAAAEVIDGVMFYVSYDDLRSWESGLRLGIRVLPPPHFEIARDVVNRLFLMFGNILKLSPLNFLPSAADEELKNTIISLRESVRIDKLIVDLSAVDSARAERFKTSLPKDVELISCERSLLNETQIISVSSGAPFSSLSARKVRMLILDDELFGMKSLHDGEDLLTRERGASISPSLVRDVARNIELLRLKEVGKSMNAEELILHRALMDFVYNLVAIGTGASVVFSDRIKAGDHLTSLAELKRLQQLLHGNAALRKFA